MEKKHQVFAQTDEDRFMEEIITQYEIQGSPYYSSARLWDDGVIDPAQTRSILGLALSAVQHAPVQKTQYGIFRI